MLRPGQKAPLYDEGDAPIVEQTEARARNPDCTGCPLHSGLDLGKRCMKPAIIKKGPETVLIVGSFPTLFEAKKGEPFLGEFGRRVRSTVDMFEAYSAVYDYGVKCPPGRTKVEAKWADACRPYLARTLEFFAYEKVILFGREAALAYLGSYVDTTSAPNAWAWSWAHEAPVYIFPGARECIENPGLATKVFARLEEVLRQSNPARPPFDATMQRVDVGSVKQFLRDNPALAEVGIDYETQGRFYDIDFEIVSAAVTDSKMQNVLTWYRDDLVPQSQLWKLLRLIMRKRSIVAHNRNFELQASAAWLEEPPTNVGFCTQMKHRLINGNARVALAHCQNEVGMGGSKDEIKPHIKAARAIVRQAAKAAAAQTDNPTDTLKRDPAYKDPDTYSYGLVDQDVLCKYNARDTLTTMRVHKFQVRTEPEFVAAGWQEYIADLTETCTYMEKTGLPADRDHARETQKAFSHAIADYDVELKQYGNINWDSGKQLAEFLYGDLKLPVPWLTEKKNPSVDKFALLKLGSEHPVVPLILARRKVVTLDKAFAWGIERFIQDDCRVHSSFKPHGTETARLASSGPNQQNTPSGDDPIAKMIKNIYSAPPGWIFIVFDHGAVEIRMAAGLSQDPVMLHLLAQGVDFHLATAKIISSIFNVDPGTLDRDHWLRGAAKTLYFALLYGKGDNSAAADLDVEVAIAKSVRGAILGANKRLSSWMDETVATAKVEGGVWVMRPTPNGMVKSRFRPLPEIRSRVNWKSAAEIRRAVNTKVQGGGAEVNNAGMIACYKWIRDNRLHPVVQMPLAVHDSLGFLVREDMVADVLYTVPRLMTQFQVGVPLAVDAQMGKRLGDLERVKLAFGGV